MIREKYKPLKFFSVHRFFVQKMFWSSSNEFHVSVCVCVVYHIHTVGLLYILSMHPLFYEIFLINEQRRNDKFRCHFLCLWCLRNCWNIFFFSFKLVIVNVILDKIMPSCMMSIWQKESSYNIYIEVGWTWWLHSN